MNDVLFGDTRISVHRGSRLLAEVTGMESADAVMRLQRTDEPAEPPVKFVLLIRSRLTPDNHPVIALASV